MDDWKEKCAFKLLTANEDETKGSMIVSQT